MEGLDIQQEQVVLKLISLVWSFTEYSKIYILIQNSLKYFLGKIVQKKA